VISWDKPAKQIKLLRGRISSSLSWARLLIITVFILVFLTVRAAANTILQVRNTFMLVANFCLVVFMAPVAGIGRIIA
jgi:hypothetical protein